MTASVWSAMRQKIAHVLNQAEIDPSMAPKIHDAGDSTHDCADDLVPLSLAQPCEVFVQWGRIAKEPIGDRDSLFRIAIIPD